MLLALPSNVIVRENAGNINSSYTTALPSSIIAEPGEYQVGLSKIQYTTTWSNVSDCTISLRYTRTDSTQHDIDMNLRNGKYALHCKVVRLLVKEKFRMLNSNQVIASDVFSVM